MSIKAMKMAIEALEAAKNNHGVMLLSDPPQEAWKFHRVSERCSIAITALRQAIEQAEQKTAVSPGKGTGFIDARALGITVLQPALETKQKTAVSLDGGKGFIDGVWHCQCGKAYEVTCISSKPKGKSWKSWEP